MMGLEEMPDMIWAVDSPNADDEDVFLLASTKQIKSPKARQYIRTDLAAPKVKPLVWNGDFAHTNTGVMYYISRDCGLSLVLEVHLGSATIKHAGGSDVDEMKRFAQADYESRILAALEGGDA